MVCGPKSTFLFKQYPVTDQMINSIFSQNIDSHWSGCNLHHYLLELYNLSTAMSTLPAYINITQLSTYYVFSSILLLNCEFFIKVSWETRWFGVTFVPPGSPDKHMLMKDLGKKHQTILFLGYLKQYKHLILSSCKRVSCWTAHRSSEWFWVSTVLVLQGTQDKRVGWVISTTQKGQFYSQWLVPGESHQKHPPTKKFEKNWAMQDVSGSWLRSG